jgi:hypothetical protein
MKGGPWKTENCGTGLGSSGSCPMACVVVRDLNLRVLRTKSLESRWEDKTSRNDDDCDDDRYALSGVWT